MILLLGIWVRVVLRKPLLYSGTASRAGRRVSPCLQAEMRKRGVVTWTRPAAGAHPAPGDIVMFAPSLVVTEAEIHRIVSVSRDVANVVLGAGQVSDRVKDFLLVAVRFAASPRGARDGFLRAGRQSA
jgi:hypothetical protein